MAVLVDGKYEKQKYLARSKEEIDVIKGMVKRAVGFDAERGDEIEVANVPFKIEPVAAVPLSRSDGADQIADWHRHRRRRAAGARCVRLSGDAPRRPKRIRRWECW